ncbi:threonine/serine exporter family protein [Fusobacterium gonidiaformans]|uniref:threonine/serine exporter family protein n=1 Tax=Fusobacterium gonidiaformans TaxID=849 RepID=UPI0001BC6457|nr:threonine/serine exporter family protein [Fusobacterium gonidiaformans]AVQ16706.1 threonine/serine exporter [Fusobacterium gonidiaformans ATCC 25563]EFS28280.1 hypothetical protein FGAG_00601 [Fusobacterium gonidiaformans ATCC 25563]
MFVYSSPIQILAAVFTTLGFGVLFNVKGNNLLHTCIAGGISWAVYLFCSTHSCSLSFSYFLATFILSLYSEIIARIKKTPVTSILIAAMIPLAPGGGIYYTMLHILQKNYPLALSKGVDTLIIAGSMAIGVFSASALFRVYQEIRH